MKLLRPMVRLLLLSLRVFNLTNMCRARYATLVATSVLLFLHVPLYYRTGKELIHASGENNSKERHLQHVLFMTSVCCSYGRQECTGNATFFANAAFLMCLYQ